LDRRQEDVVVTKRLGLVVGGSRLEIGGGVVAVCREIMAALMEEDWDVRYLSADARMERSVLASLPLQRGWGSSASSALVASEARSLGAEIVITNGPLGAGIRGRDLSVHFYHGTYRGQALAIAPYISRRGAVKLAWLDGMVLERAAGFGKICLANSPSTADEVSRFFGYSTVVVGCPVDTTRFAPGDGDPGVLERLAIPPGARVGLFLGAGRPMKGDRAAISVVRSTPDARWIIVGAQPSTVPKNAQVLPSIARDLMPRILRSVDVVLAPSVYEPFGILQLEALASGTPVVAGRFGGSDFLDLSEALAGWIVPDPRDATALKAAVDDVFSNLRSASERALGVRPRIHDRLAPSVWRRVFVETIGLSDRREP
jgi:glycosyltransferase involved in cell wall biosynthesis